MSRRALAALAVVGGLGVGYAVVLTAPDAEAFPRVVARTTLVSRSAFGVQATDRSYLGAISDDGSFVAFDSKADNLVPPDSNSNPDVFRKNVFTGAIDLVSVDSSGVQGNSVSNVCDMSSDGRYVVFSSKATNLIGNDTNGQVRDIYVRDMVNGTTELVSRNTAGDQANGGGLNASISDDGRYVAFDSTANNLVDRHGREGLSHVYLRDRSLGTTVRIDTSTVTSKGANGDGSHPAISDDGRYVAFESAADDLLTTADTNGATDVFRWNRTTGSNERISVTGVSTEGDDGSLSPAISADGQTVAFVSRATNFGGAPEPTWGMYRNIYVRYVPAHVTELVNVTTNGNPPLGLSNYPSISDNGRQVSFSSEAGNLVPADTNGVADIFVRDLLGGRTSRRSITDARMQSNGASTHSAITGDGVQIAFESGATNLVTDLNGEWDVFVTPIGPIEVVPHPSGSVLHSVPGSPRPS
jgi:hypothetical protein